MTQSVQTLNSVIYRIGPPIADMIIRNMPENSINMMIHQYASNYEDQKDIPPHIRQQAKECMDNPGLVQKILKAELKGKLDKLVDHYEDILRKLSQYCDQTNPIYRAVKKECDIARNFYFRQHGSFVANIVGHIPNDKPVADLPIDYRFDNFLDALYQVGEAVENQDRVGKSYGIKNAQQTGALAGLDPIGVQKSIDRVLKGGIRQYATHVDALDQSVIGRFRT